MLGLWGCTELCETRMNIMKAVRHTGTFLKTPNYQMEDWEQPALQDTADICLGSASVHWSGPCSQDCSLTFCLFDLVLSVFVHSLMIYNTEAKKWDLISLLCYNKFVVYVRWIYTIKHELIRKSFAYIFFGTRLNWTEFELRYKLNMQYKCFQGELVLQGLYGVLP